MPKIDVAMLQKRVRGLFPEVLGIRFVEASVDLVRAELTVRDDLCTVPGIMHGGAIMAFADTLGAVGTVLNLPPGAGTTTIESKTNFFAGAPYWNHYHRRLYAASPRQTHDGMADTSLAAGWQASSPRDANADGVGGPLLAVRLAALPHRHR